MASTDKLTNTIHGKKSAANNENKSSGGSLVRMHETKTKVASKYMMVNTLGLGNKKRALKSFKQLRNITMTPNKPPGLIENHLTSKLKVSVEDLLKNNKTLEKKATLEPIDPQSNADGQDFETSSKFRP